MKLDAPCYTILLRMSYKRAKSRKDLSEKVILNICKIQKEENEARVINTGADAG